MSNENRNIKSKKIWYTSFKSPSRVSLFIKRKGGNVGTGTCRGFSSVVEIVSGSEYLSRTLMSKKYREIFYVGFYMYVHNQTVEHSCGS